MSDNSSNNDNNYDSFPGDPNFVGGYTPQFPEQPPKQGKAIASLVLGIVSIVICCIPAVPVLASIAGLITGIVSLNKREGGKGMAIAGIILSGIGLLIGIVISIYYILVGVELFNGSFMEEYQRVLEEMEATGGLQGYEY
ncbi:MAG: DUF4190 domain-containing protein [Clostridiales bacterium]|jgi:hypothetical protein|nr:DUF4190 domain-containing protein [Clostridiales bacterium]